MAHTHATYPAHNSCHRSEPGNQPVLVLTAALGDHTSVHQVYIPVYIQWAKTSSTINKTKTVTIYLRRQLKQSLTSFKQPISMSKATSS